MGLKGVLGGEAGESSGEKKWKGVQGGRELKGDEMKEVLGCQSLSGIFVSAELRAKTIRKEFNFQVDFPCAAAV